MKFLSVCSGIEAASVAWQPLGWKAVAFSEIEPFPCAVLAHHYPDTPNWGDMTKFKDWPDVSIDLLCGGTPCQSFSVAGLRKGLDDPRGNLMLTFGAIAAKYRPQWLVWENVPGVLSSNAGADFGAFLGMLGQLGYGFAYRVLDAQYFGVAQRRRRVFVVGCLGDWRSAAAVLFERHSLQGRPAPRRQAGQGTAHSLAPSLTASGRGVERTGETRGQDPVVAVAGTTKACKDSGGWSNSADHAAAGYMIPVRTLCVATGQAGAEIGADMAPTLNCNHEAPYIAHSLRGEGFDASEDGTGRGTPLVPVGVTIHGTDKTVNVMSFTDVAGSIRTKPPGSIENSSTTAGLQPVAVSVSLRGREGGATAELGDEVGNCLRASGGDGDKAHVLTIAFDSRMRGAEPAVGREERPPQTMVERTGAIDATKPWNVATAMQVRRLTPEECEALQGFPRSYTNVPHRGKPASDGPRYKALGNSWAVPNVRWIGERIDLLPPKGCGYGRAGKPKMETA